MKKNVFLLVLIIVFLGLFFLYQQKGKSDTIVVSPDDSRFELEEALVDRVDILILESFPVQVEVVAVGNLRNGCSSLGDFEIVKEGSTFDIDLMVRVEKDVMCTQALIPFEKKIRLDVLGLLAGEYLVDVNGAMGSFTLEVDNLITAGQEE